MAEAMERIWLSSYAEGVPHDIEPVTGSLVGPARLVSGAVRPNEPRWSSSVLRRPTPARRPRGPAAEGLRRLGRQHAATGSRCVLPNCPQHVVAFYAVLRLGAVVVEHNPLYTAEELEHQFGDHGATRRHRLGQGGRHGAPGCPARRSTSSPSTSSHAMPLAKRLALRLPIAGSGRPRAALTAPAPGHPRGRQLLGARLGSTPPTRGRRSSDLAAIQYTSGTTGRAEGRDADAPQPRRQRRRRAEPGCPGSATVRRSSTRSCRCSTPTA